MGKNGLSDVQRAACRAAEKKAGDDFEVKVESVQKLNGIEKEAFVISRKKDWIAPTIYVELLYECCLQGVPLSQIAEKVLEQYRKVEAEDEKTGEAAFYQLEKCCAADLLRAHSCGEKPVRCSPKFPHRKISRSRGRVLLPDAGKPRAGCDNSDPRDAPGAVGNFGGGAGCPCLGEHPAGSAGAHRQPYGVLKEEYGVTFPLFELGPLAEQFYLVSNRRGKLGAICMCYPGVLESLSQRFEASLM